MTFFDNAQINHPNFSNFWKAISPEPDTTGPKKSHGLLKLMGEQPPRK